MANDGTGATLTEKRTLKYIVTEMKLQDEAVRILSVFLNPPKTGSYYKQIDGVKYDRELLEAAKKAQKTGKQISRREAKELVEESQDAGRQTATEKTTLEYILAGGSSQGSKKEFKEDSMKHGGWWACEKYHEVTGPVAIQFPNNCYMKAMDNGKFVLGAPHGDGEGPDPEEIVMAMRVGGEGGVGAVGGVAGGVGAGAGAV